MKQLFCIKQYVLGYRLKTILTMNYNLIEVLITFNVWENLSQN